MLSTFSKEYRLTGLRAGYAIDHSDVITTLDKVYVPFTVSSRRQDDAIVAIKAAEELLASTEALVSDQDRVSATWRYAGFALPPVQTNFVWVTWGITH
ncbi:aminotransferase class I/II-fold pyridoxal phosphate-dependent enzyme [Mycobacterium lepromatosis]|uniref:aminotransferase class I/II-fold pyridoxal phosphate-dependent enzyme n=1 Tax=Mycobacterium lepromatosis TaxID=480418 RepID=UPI000679620A|nr:aminotransferase class I/II-fold pyridoxal phosphate-dependent enzyme [Mycobacterium lepromatosis]